MRNLLPGVEDVLAHLDVLCIRQEWRSALGQGCGVLEELVKQEVWDRLMCPPRIVVAIAVNGELVAWLQGRSSPVHPQICLDKFGVARESLPEHISFLGIQKDLFPLFEERVQMLGEQRALCRFPVNLAEWGCALGQLSGVLDKVEPVEVTIL